MPELSKEKLEEKKKKIRSKLEFLLSQNDILPLLKSLNGKEHVQNDLFDFQKLTKNEVN